ncbi:MAG: hypothetical protein QNL61_01100 [Crocinitomicaceae bacterium]|mgnify:CR=1 FL=1|jgi:hypothetical protein
MILVGFNWQDVLFGMLWVSIIVLVLIIGYKKLLSHLGRNDIKKEDYCVLFNVEESPVTGEIPFYYTSEQVKNVAIWIQDSSMNDLFEVSNQECKVGGNIIRYNSENLQNGTYFYCLKTENQKISKKMIVFHG